MVNTTGVAKSLSKSYLLDFTLGSRVVVRVCVYTYHIVCLGGEPKAACACLVADEWYGWRGGSADAAARLARRLVPRPMQARGACCSRQARQSWPAYAPRISCLPG